MMLAVARQATENETGTKRELAEVVAATSLPVVVVLVVLLLVPAALVVVVDDVVLPAVLDEVEELEVEVDVEAARAVKLGTIAPTKG